MSEQQTKPPMPADPTAAVVAAEAVLEKLKTERKQVAGKIAEHDKLSAELAFKAKGEGDAAAAQALAVARKEAIDTVAELREFDHAIAAEQQLASAQRKVMLLAARDRALQRKQAIADLRELAPTFDEALEDLIKVSQALVLGAGQLRAVGGGLSDAQVFTLHRSVSAALGRTPFAREYPVIPPLERKLPSVVITTGWIMTSGWLIASCGRSTPS
jgi:hypothetical protein